jgi:hypothetical protein
MNFKTGLKVININLMLLEYKHNANTFNNFYKAVNNITLAMIILFKNNRQTQTPYLSSLYPILVLSYLLLAKIYPILD